jgi:2-hydroxychromene-2-carboxylate isomerase
MSMLWTEGKDPGLPENLNAVAASVGLSGDELTQMAQDPEIKEVLKQNTAEAVERGAFGAPTFFVGKKMFWGHDRMVLLEAYLKGSLPQKE